MKKSIFSLMVFCIMYSSGFAQDINLIGRLNGSIGLEYESVDYNGGSLAYSPGGGIGLEIGAEYNIFKGIYGYGTLGYQYNLALQLETGTNGSNKSSATFGRTFFTFGIHKLFILSDNTLHGISIGVGGNYSIPAKLKITENDRSLEPISFESGLGFHIDAKLRLKLSDSFFLDPGLRYRQLELDAKTTGTLNASGIEIGISVIKKL